MKFNFRRPCNDCPFLRVGGITLRPSRVREIADATIGRPGLTFACHKTVEYNDAEFDGDGDPVQVDPAAQSHCAGALIFAQKHDAANQMHRIAERSGLYDPAILDPAAFSEVWDSTAEWVARNSC